MKKGKVISMPSTPEAQIRTRARNLPLGQCYVNDNWEESKMATVIVTRKHVNGNITYCGYLVDLLLLGVKDCFYAFNEIPSELEEQLDEWDLTFIECDYVLAHNIVYESVAFAEDYGFEPVKEFTKTGIYVLEEDSDLIPEMYIPLGEDGIPVVFIEPDDDHRREIAILEKTAGPEDFIVYHVDKDGNIVDEDGNIIEDDDDDDLLPYVEAINEITELGLDEFVAKYKNNLEPEQMLAVVDITYCASFNIPDLEMITEMMELILGDPRFDLDLERIPGINKYIDALQSIVNKTVDDEDAALAEMEALRAEYPDDIDLALLHINLLRDMEQTHDAERLICEWYDHAGDHYAMRLLYAEWLTEQERFEEVFELFGNKPGLDALTTDDAPFTDVIVAEFCACYVHAWLSKDGIDKAEPYYRIMILLDVRTTSVVKALLAMMEKKKGAVMEIGRRKGIIS